MKWTENEIEGWLTAEQRQFEYPRGTRRTLSQPRLTWERFDYLTTRCGFPPAVFGEMAIDWLAANAICPFITFELAFTCGVETSYKEFFAPAGPRGRFDGYGHP